MQSLNSLPPKKTPQLTRTGGRQAILNLSGSLPSHTVFPMSDRYKERQALEIGVLLPHQEAVI